jgi:PAS domain S-box-containing protein
MSGERVKASSMTSQPPATRLPEAPEMAERVRLHDWSRTVLGPQQTWPASLKVVISVMLASGFPMCVRWGPELVMIYNDGYRSILGDRHPAAFGLPFHEAWPEVQEQLHPLHEAILNGESGAYFAEDYLIRVQRRTTAEWEDARFTLSYSPVPDDSVASGVGGVLVTVVETTERVRTEAALRASEERFAGIFDQTGVGVLQCELDGRFLLVNKRFCEIVGRPVKELLALRVPDITHPEHRESDVALRNQLVADGIPFSVDKRYLRPDGSEVWVNVNVSLARSADGTRPQLIGVAQDITEQRQAQDQQNLLVRELHHRIKNLFAVTGSIISISARSAQTAKDYEANIRGRLEALAVANEMVLPVASGDAATSEQPKSLDALLLKILSPYARKHGVNGKTSVVTGGPPVTLGPRTIPTLALIVHELATNAAKYGALSTDQGQLRITWQCVDGVLAMAWNESGGPAVNGPPRSRGFGTLLSNQSVSGELGGSIAYCWNPSGLSVELSAPLDRLNR